jgi:tellurite methyltransferase
MDLHGWNARYRTETEDMAPAQLLVEAASRLRPGKALDLACGAGRNALWLARQGWRVTAVDGALEAIAILRRQAEAQDLEIETQVADLERGEFRIAPAAWDLIAMCYYLQRDLFAPAKNGLAANGILLAIVHITEGGEEPTHTRARPGELRSFFQDWNIVHYFEGKPRDSAHRRSVAEIVARPLPDDGRACLKTGPSTEAE